MAQTTIIRATSRASIKVGDSFYTVEYGEERSVEDTDNLESERADLWETCNGEVDRQIEEIMQMFKDRKK
jgi:hypothetical protein